MTATLDAFEGLAERHAAMQEEFVRKLGEAIRAVNMAGLELDEALGRLPRSGQCEYLVAGYRRCARDGGSEFMGLLLCWQHSQVAEDAALGEITEGSDFARRARDGLRQLDEYGDWQLLEPEPGPTTVYFVKRHQFVKIGYATDVRRRIKDIVAGSGIITGMVASPVKLLATIPGGKPKESKLHRRFRHIRVGGEWFLHNDELRDFIGRIDKARA